jgi:ABC-2 type transport system permease protein
MGVLMGNVLAVAKKEFLDLVSSKQIIVILGVYALFFFLSIRGVYSTESVILNGLSLSYVSYDLCHVLTTYGSLVAIVIGFSSISSEMGSKAFNTLIAKPVYRDQVINGKMIGMASFICCLLVASILFYISLLIIVFGNVLDTIIIPLMNLMPMILVFSFLVLVFFLSLSIFLSIIIKEDNISLFFGFLVWIILLILIPSQHIAGFLSYFLSMIFSINWEIIESFISGLSPQTMLVFIFGGMGGADNDFLAHGSVFLQLALYAVVMVILSYSAFLKRDVA